MPCCKRELAYRLQRLDFERKRYESAAPLLPGVDALIALAEARRALDYADPRSTAATLERVRKSLADLQARIERDAKSAPVQSPIIAYRAARLLDGVRGDLKDWYTFYNGYDPAFTWWNKLPYEALDKQLESSRQAAARQAGRRFESGNDHRRSDWPRGARCPTCATR